MPQKMSKCLWDFGGVLKPTTCNRKPFFRRCLKLTLNFTQGLAFLWIMIKFRPKVFLISVQVLRWAQARDYRIDDRTTDDVNVVNLPPSHETYRGFQQQSVLPEFRYSAICLSNWRHRCSLVYSVVTGFRREKKRLLMWASSFTMKNEFKTRITWIRASSTSFAIIFARYIIWVFSRLKLNSSIYLFVVYACVFIYCQISSLRKNFKLLITPC